MDNDLSKGSIDSKGVPQGSVLSLLLFHVMLDDFLNPDNDCELSLFADYVAIYFTVKSKEATEAPYRTYCTK